MQDLEFETEEETLSPQDRKEEDQGDERASDADEPAIPAPEPRHVDHFDGKQCEVDPASILVHRIQNMLAVLGFGAPLVVVLTVVWALGDLPWWVYFPLLLAGLGIGFLRWQWPVLHHRHLRYRVDASGLQIQRGVLWQASISIPTTRVQHTDVTQGPLQRQWSLATLTVHTAGTRGASISLAGLNHEIALGLRDHLLPSQNHGD